MPTKAKMDASQAQQLYETLTTQMRSNEQVFAQIKEKSCPQTEVQQFEARIPQVHSTLIRLENFANQQKQSHSPQIAPNIIAEYMGFSERAAQQLATYESYFMQPENLEVEEAQKAVQFAHFAADEDCDEFVQEVAVGLKQMKHELRRVNEGLEDGKEVVDKMGNEVNKANDEAKLANSKVNQAREYMRKNRDWAFLGTAVLEFVILVIMFIV